MEVVTRRGWGSWGAMEVVKRREGVWRWKHDA